MPSIFTLYCLSFCFVYLLLFPSRYRSIVSQATATNLTAHARSFLASPTYPPPHFSGTLLPPGSFTPPLPPNSSLLRSRRDSIRKAVIHAWDAYVTYAWGHDELCPLSLTSKDTFAPNLGITILDSLSTLYLFNLSDRYTTARDWVANHLDFSQVGRVIVFETVIRALGGLLSMFHLSGDPMYLHKAEELGVRLSAGFDTSSGLPWPRCWLNDTGRCTTHENLNDAIYLAEVGSLQLEYRALAWHSRLPVVRKMRNVVERIIPLLQTAGSSTGRLHGEGRSLLPYALLRTNGRYCTNMVTMGAPADSYFEYLVKVWVQGGRKERRYWELARDVIDSMVDIVGYKSKRGDVITRDVLVGIGGKLEYSSKMDHFSCYIPGMVMLATDGLDKDDEERRKRWVGFAEDITDTCWKMYSRSKCGLAGEWVRLGGTDDEWKMGGGYQLRPEAVEAFFYMWRYTRNEKYREWAWKVFEGIEKHCKVKSGGYAAIKNSRSMRPKKEDVMHSFLIAETFKYIWLIHGEDENEMRLDEWVFNTEAHPLLITPSMGDEPGSGERQRDHGSQLEKDEL